MKNVLFALALVASMMPLGAAADINEPSIQGKYLEARSCDVWAGYCFSNGEVNLTGEEATLVWDVTKGSWNGETLDGLKVIGVVKASATLGDTEHDALPAKSIVIVDERATEAQRAALVEFAKDAAGELLSDVISVRPMPIESKIEDCGTNECARIVAGDDVEISARCVHDGDKICGHESSIYGPLTDVDFAMTHLAEMDRFSGKGLNVTWDNGGRKSVYIGSFSR